MKLRNDLVPIKMPYHNQTFNAPVNDPSVLPLSAYVNTSDPTISTCWKVNWYQRLKILFSGKITLWIMSMQLPPMSVEAGDSNLSKFYKLQSKQQ